MEVGGAPNSENRTAASAEASTARRVDPESSCDEEPAARDGSSGGAVGARYKLMSPAKLPISRSPCLTIPPGLSPSSFLESPVLLSNVKAEQSPTTGSFFKHHMMHAFGGSTMFSSNITSSGAVDKSGPKGFEFQTPAGSSSVADLFMGGPMASADINTRQRFLCKFASSDASISEVASFSNPIATASIEETKTTTIMPHEIDSDRSSQRLNSTAELQSLQHEHAGAAAVMTDRISEDGYNWRKYGQKLVKGCEYPRSYYKCTHPNCEVKKLFERAPDGQITEIIYKGTHDHPRPQPSRRMASGGSLMSIQEEGSEKFSSLAGQEDKPSGFSGQMSYNNDQTVNPELSPRAADENGTEGEVSPINRISDEDDDPLLKRRKMEIGGMDINSVIKPIREPRVVVQTLSEVDILDDGYRWRKYGQKVVRGNPNPRSYYKCTSVGCPVRKHVERASHDPKAVITTYEGKHNHDVPAAKNSSHDATSNLASRVRSLDNEAVSLDLGVGINPGSENGSHMHHQRMDAGEPGLGQTHIGGSNILFLQQMRMSSHPGYLNGPMRMYASRENHGEGISVRNPPALNHSSPPHYSSNMGRLLMGP